MSSGQETRTSGSTLDRPPGSAGVENASGAGRWALVGLFVVVALQLLLVHAFFHDDAYIALRYADHLVLGEGLVWNPDDRVEGYTSLSWVLLTAALHALGMDLVTAARWLGLGSWAALVFALLRRPCVSHHRRARGVAAVLVAGSGACAAWAMGGLETCLFALLSTLALSWVADACEAGEPRKPALLVLAGLALAGGQLTRPEGVLVSLTCIAFVGWQVTRGWRLRWPALLGLLGLPSLALGLQLAFRRTYYGEWLPNTAHAKGGTELLDLAAGMAYLAQFSLDHLPWLALLAWGLLRGRAASPRREQLFGGFVAGYSAYVLLIGGDHMPWHRFLVPILPPLAVLIAGRIQGLPHARLGLAIALVWSLGATFARGVWGMPHGWLIDPAAVSGEIVGRHMAEHWPADATVALNTAGSTPYYSGLRAIDMLGLNDHHIARAPIEAAPELPWAQLPGHRRGDGDYVLSRRPDFIILGGSQGSERAVFSGDKQLLAHPAFRRDYRLETAELATPEGVRFTFRYYRRIVR